MHNQNWKKTDISYDNILFFTFDGRVFKQTTGTHMRTNCDPVLAN